MKKIVMVDLKSQYQKIKHEIDTSIAKVLDSTQFIKGEQVESFQNHLSEYLHCKHVITCANGTEALQVALMSLGLRASDEIIVPDFTFVACAEVVGLLNLRPVFVDVDKESFCVTKKNIEQAISVKTKAIIPVHLFGQTCQMEQIMEIAHKYNLFVVEDTAQAIGSVYSFEDSTKKYAGTIGNIGCTSFFPSKNLGCYGDGGALFTDDDDLAQKIAMITNHGCKTKYHHEILGINSRLDSIQAAILDVKLKYLNDYIDKRQQAAKYYDQGLKDIEGLILPKVSPNTTHTYHQYTIQVLDQRRDALKEFLAKNDIPSMVYYPIALHNQEAFMQIARQGNQLDTSEMLCQQVLSLPMHTELDKQQQDYIIDKIKEFFK